MTTQTPAQPEGLLYAHMPSYGRADFRQLREAVSEAACGNRDLAHDPDPERYPGHVMVEGINYNSLNRIVTAFVDAARTPAPEQAVGGCVDWEWSDGKSAPRCRRDKSCGAHVPDACPLATPEPPAEQQPERQMTYTFLGVRYTKDDMAIAQQIACKIVQIYGEGDDREIEAAKTGSLWNDHPAVQAALLAGHRASTSEQQQPVAFKPDDIAWIEVRVDVDATEGEWTFCTPRNHPDDIASGYSEGEWADQNQFFGGPLYANPPAQQPGEMREKIARYDLVTDIDVPKGAWPWIEAIATEMPGPNIRIETPKDAEFIVFWHDERVAAMVVNVRTQFNNSHQYRFDLRPLAVTETPLHDQQAGLLSVDDAFRAGYDAGAELERKKGYWGRRYVRAKEDALAAFNASRGRG